MALPEGAAGQTGVSQIPDSLTAESLLQLSQDGRPLPRLAATWSRSVDGLEWIFTLRSNATFHNGKPADASAIALLFREALRTPYVKRFHTQLSAVTSIEAVGKHTLRVRTRRKQALLLDDLADLRLRGQHPGQSLGPFIVEDTSKNPLRARAFPDYFLGRPGIDGIVIQSYPTLRAAWAAMMRNEIDALYEVNRDALDFVERENRVSVYRFLRPYVAHLLFNVDTPQLRAPAVRRAISEAIDRESIVRHAYRGAARAAAGPLWPDHWALTSDLPRYSYDRARARATVEKLARTSTAAGSSMPARVRFTCLVPEVETQPMERMALLLQKQLYAVGIDMRLEAVTSTEAMSRVSQGGFEAILFEFAARTPGWLYPMWHSPEPNEAFAIKSGYRAADMELEALKNATNDSQVRTALAAVYRKMYEDPPSVFIAWPEVARAVSTNFEVLAEKESDVMGPNLRLWRPARDLSTP